MPTEHGNTVESSESIFAEAFAAASGATVENTPETNEPVDLQDTNDSYESEETSGLEAGEEVEGDINSELEASDESSESNDETSENDLSSESVKEISVKGKDGKRRNIKVDFSDHERMTKYVQKAANAVRLQSERDALQAKVDKMGEAQTALENLQSIVDRSGFEGLIDHLNSDNGGFQAWMDQKMSRHEQRLHASDDELARLDAEDKAAELQRRLELYERQQQEREERINRESEQAKLDKLQSEVNPIYFKYTFDGKLGDSVAEQRHNKAMFREVTETLDTLAEEGVKITPAIIEREFRAYATPLLKGVNRRVRQNTKRAIDKKKTEATANAQQQVRKGNSSSDLNVDNAKSPADWAKLWLSGKLKG